MKTIAQIAAASTADLVAFYNKATGKSIKKFSSRAAAEKQCAACLKAEPAPAAKHDDAPKGWAALSWKEKLALWHKEWRCPHCGDKDNGVTAAGEEGTAAGDNRSYCHICSTEFHNDTGKKYNAPSQSINRADAVKASWQDPDVAQARAMRYAVVADGVEYKSLAKAFRALKLSMSQLVKFRLELVAKGKGKHEGHDFKIAKK